MVDSAVRVKCKVCRYRIRDDWAAKWKHIVNRHPDILASHLLPLIQNPLEAHAFGSSLAKQPRSSVGRPSVDPHEGKRSGETNLHHETDVDLAYVRMLLVLGKILWNV